MEKQSNAEVLFDANHTIGRTQGGDLLGYIDEEVFKTIIDKFPRQPYDLVEEFHRVFNHSVGTVQYQPDHDTREKELDVAQLLIEEEYHELLYALAHNEPAENVLKESCDLVYVILGLCVRMGWDFTGAFKAVHESNMSKLGDDGQPIYREDGKVLKGPGYQAPDITPFV